MIGIAACNVKRQKKSGFTLIKTVVAISLLSIVLTVATRLIAVSAKTIQNNRKQLTAVYLGQQCLEWTRNMRDSAWKQNLPWDCGFQNTSGGVDEENILNVISSGSSGTCKKNIGFMFSPYNKTKAIVQREEKDSLYTRKVLLKSKKDEIQVTCQIAWENETLSFDQVLTNWKK